MSNLTSAQKRAYVHIIQKLYGSSIYVDEDMINQEVVDIVITILDEIRKCNLRLAIFTTIANALAAALQSAWENFAIPDPKKFLEDFFKEDKNIFKNQLMAFGEEFLKEFISQWFYILTNQRQARICLLSAARNHKSALAIALLGI